MADVNTQIRTVIDRFVEQLNGLVRRAALEAVSGALGGAPVASLGVVGVRPRRGRPPKALPGTPAPVFAAASRGPGAKRPPQAIAELTEQLYQYIQANPGQSIESIGKEMGIPTKELTLPVKKLIAEGRITTEGQKRATKYFAASAAPSPAAAKSAAAKPGAKPTGAKRGRRPRKAKAGRPRPKRRK